MTYGSDVRLTTVRLDRMRPTQVTVGYREVQTKRNHWKSLSKKDRKDAIAAHWFPAVLGPDGDYYIVDHHHLGLALLEEGVSDARVMVLKDLSWLDTTIFWRMMEHNQWVHPYGVDGERCAYSRLPKTLTSMKDDPYRSLAGEMRIAGGFAKDATPFSEFLWADYLRPRIKPAALRKDFDQALRKAMVLAHGQDARYLPGWSGEAHR
jgi:hypothetical protein